MVIIIRAVSGILPIRLIVFVGIQTVFFHVSSHSLFGVIGVDFIRMAITNVVKVGFRFPVIKTIELDPNTVPKTLRAGATEINVRGEYPGKYYLVPYNGKLKKFTDKKQYLSSFHRYGLEMRS